MAGAIYAHIHKICFGMNPQHDVVEYMQDKGLLSSHKGCNNCHGMDMEIRPFTQCSDKYVWRCPEKNCRAQRYGDWLPLEYKTYMD